MALKKLYLSADNSTWVNSGTYGIYLNSDTYLNAPAFDYTEYSVPARNGNLIAYNHRYGNVLRRFDCYINASVETNFDSFKKWIYTHPGYIYIKSDYDSATYQKGYLAQDIEVEPFNKDGNYSIQFSLYFSCQPQKFSTSTSETTVTRESKTATRVCDRNDPRIKAVLNKLSPSQIPEDTIFFLKQISASYDSYTNFTLSWSGGNVFSCIYQEASFGSNEIESIINVSHTSVSNLSFTATLYHSVNVIVGYRDTGSIPIYFMHGGTGDWTRTIGNVGVNLATIQSSGSTGADLGNITANMLSTDSLTAVSSWVIIRRYLDNLLVAEGIIKLTPDGSVDVSAYKTGYAYDLVLNVENLTCYCVKTNLPSINCNSYMNMIGNFSGFCDKITVDAYADNVYGYGYIDTLKVAPTWWKV